MSPERRRHGLALATTALLVAGSVGIAIGLSDRPLGPLPGAAPPGSRAAVAVRDHVHPFQKFGTRLFTLPALEAAYAEVHYFTQDGYWDPVPGLDEALDAALSSHESVDLFILAHSNRLVDTVHRLPPERRARLRLVYNTGCADQYQSDEWLAAGAAAYVGHPGDTSISPVFYVYFLRRWIRGAPVEEAVEAANTATFHRLRVAGALSLGRLDGDGLARQSVGVATGDGGLVVGGP